MSVLSFEGYLSSYSGLWYALMDTRSYVNRVRPALRTVIRSRGRHSPGSGNYCYGACTIHDHTVTCEGVPILFPGESIFWESEDGTERYQEWWVGDYMVYYLHADIDSRGYWHYHQAFASTVHFVYDKETGVPEMTNFVKYCVPDGFTSRQWLSYEEFPWEPHGGNGVNGCSLDRITVQYSDVNFGRRLWDFMDKLTLQYDVWTNEYLALAYVDAIAKAPINRVNNVANIINAVTAFTRLVEAPDLVVDIAHSARELKKMLSDAWLRYRYQLTTTVMDVSEMTDLALRSAHSPQRIKCNGFVTCEHDGDQWEFRCSVHLTADEVNSLQNDMEKFGVALSAYNAWDMVPYSFIADWFLNIGDKLEFYEDRNRAMRLRPSGAIWFSVVRRHSDEISEEDFYFRWQGGVPSYSPTFVKDGDPKTSTIIKRVADVLALV